VTTDKLTVYFGERERAGDRSVADALLDLFARQRIASSVLLRGIEGFGAKHQLRTDRSLTLSEDLPAVAIALDTSDQIDAVRAEIRTIAGGGLVLMDRADPAPPAGPGTARLTVHLGRKDRFDGMPAFVAVTRLLQQRGIAGATALLGVDGTAAGARQRAHFFGRNAQVPVIISAVGTGAELDRLLPELAALSPGAVRVVESVQLCKHDGVFVAPPTVSGTWQRLTVHSSERALHDGMPIHRALVRRLRAGGAAGATSLRGIWGFAGDQPAHGDRLLQLGRRVPVVTTVVDRAERTAENFAIVDELTAERGLVICEPIGDVG
jgi:PII-like signaling protein